MSVKTEISGLSEPDEHRNKKFFKNFFKKLGKIDFLSGLLMGGENISSLRGGEMF